jgi:hypothetical protein
MHAKLAQACGTLEIGLPALARAAELSGEQVEVARGFFQERLGTDDRLDIVVCGSMARREMSRASDFDYLVLAHGLVEDASRPREFRRACDRWREDRGIREPGSSGVFGQVVAAADLVEQIGLELDTNSSLTRRVLLIEEGVSVLVPELHRKLIATIVGRYLHEDPSDTSGPPRFLLNDVVRYWRTIAVDYQAKVWRDLTVDGWGLRYLKLRISRKLTFVGALVSLFLVEIAKPSDVRAFLTEQFVDVPALARVAQLVDVLGDDAAAIQDLRRVFEIADAFCEFLHDGERRRAANSVLPPAKEASDPGFVAVRELSVELQACLERLFFDTRALRGLSRKYLTF